MPLSPPAAKAQLSHTLATGMASLTLSPCYGTVEWHWRREASGGSLDWSAVRPQTSRTAVPVTACAQSDGSMLESRLCESADGETAGAVDAMYGAAASRA